MTKRTLNWKINIRNGQIVWRTLSLKVKLVLSCNFLSKKIVYFSLLKSHHPYPNVKSRLRSKGTLRSPASAFLFFVVPNARSLTSIAERPFFLNKVYQCILVVIMSCPFYLLWTNEYKYKILVLKLMFQSY